MSGLDAFTCTPRQVRRFIIRCMRTNKRLVAMVESSPGNGKSAIVASIAKDYRLKLIDHRLSTSVPEDLNGLPRFTEEGNATFAPFDMFPTEDTPLPIDENGVQMEGWLLFLDEFNSASKAVQAAAYKLVLDKMIGQKRLHERVVIVCAGNLMTDRAIVNSMSTAMQSRLVWLKMEPDHDEFMEDVAFAQSWDKRIVAYLSYKKSALNDFRPDHNDKTFCCPRTWEFMNELVRDNEVTAEDAALYAGTITSGVAVDFIQFTKVFETLPNVKTIIKDPNGTTLPVDNATRWATVTHLIDHSEDENFEPIATYINRFPSDFRILFYRSLLIRKPVLKRHASFRKAMVELSRYLHDDDVANAA